MYNVHGRLHGNGRNVDGKNEDDMGKIGLLKVDDNIVRF
jgi:hypothetical protein